MPPTRLLSTLYRLPSLFLAASSTLTLISCVTEPTRKAISDIAQAQTVIIQRTTDDIPHILAADWEGLGFGQGYAQAQDALCTLAEGFVTYSGQRSFFFGPKERPQTPSTFGQPPNLDLDTFFRALLGEQKIQDFQTTQPEEIQKLVRGYVDGYNRYLNETQRNPRDHDQLHCIGEKWVQNITVAQVYRRMVALNLIAGYGNFLKEIVHTTPPNLPSKLSKISFIPTPSLQQRLVTPVGGTAGLGSNMLAFGDEATSETGSSVLLGNPHWFWSGIDRFYQNHLTMPGQIDAAGVSFLGVPLLMIGFNHDVAWSHTVSTARRFGLFELQLNPADPTQYLIDGQSYPMETITVAIPTRKDNGSISTIHRTLYRTSLGFAIDLREMEPNLSWTSKKVLVIRDINEFNNRAYRNFLRWSQARSLDEFVSIQKEEAGMPWVNTAAIGKGDGRVWYADIGQIPNVPDALRQQCQTSASSLFARFDPSIPVLDGSLSTCHWQNNPRSWQPGAMPADALPSIWRRDYVANMNDSYWLTQPMQPLEGFPRNLGGEKQAPSQRSREGFRIAAAMMGKDHSTTEAFATQLGWLTLESRSYTADTWKSPLLLHACHTPTLETVINQNYLDSNVLGSMQKACSTLAQWSNTADPDARGVFLWDAFWRKLKHSNKSFFATAFSSDDPLHTPKGIAISPTEIATALLQAIEELQQHGIDPTASMASYRHLLTPNEDISFYGGCSDIGYFAITCTSPQNPMLSPSLSGNGYLQLAFFDSQGKIHVRTLLAHGQSDQALSSTGSDLAPILRYVKREWLSFLFFQDDIARDSNLTRTSLRYQPTSDITDNQ